MIDLSIDEVLRWLRKNQSQLYHNNNDAENFYNFLLSEKIFLVNDITDELYQNWIVEQSS